MLVHPICGNRQKAVEVSLLFTTHSLSSPIKSELHPLKVNFALGEVHEGIFGSHVKGCTLTYKILRHGYYWLSILKDAIEYMRCYDYCQRHPTSSINLLYL